MKTFATLLILFLGLALRLFVASDPYLHEWDERFHALVAKNMMHHPFRPTLYAEPVLPENTKEHWSTGHLWLHKPPLPLWSMALSMRVLGVNEWALRLPSVLLSTLGIWLLYGLGSRLFGVKNGLLAAFLFAINGLVLELTGGRVATDHVDLFFLFFVLLGVFFAERHTRKRSYLPAMLLGLSVGAAILVKWLPAIIVFPVWGFLYLHFHKKIDLHFGKAVRLALLTTFLVAAPWQIYIFQVFPEEAAWEAAFNRQHIFEALDGHGQPFGFHLMKMGRIYGFLMYPALFWLGYQTWRSAEKRWLYAALLTWILVPLLFFSLAKTKMQAYTIFSAPAGWLTYSLFVFSVLKAIHHRELWQRRLLLFLFLLQPVIYGVERAKFFPPFREKPAWMAEIAKLKQEVEVGQPTVIFNANRPIETMFYINDVSAYGFTPDSHIVDSLKNEGYIILSPE